MAGNTPDAPLQMDESSFRPLDKIGSQPAAPSPAISPDSTQGLTMDQSTFKPLSSPSSAPASADSQGQNETQEQFDQRIRAGRAQNLAEVGKGIVKGAGQTVNSI